MQRRRIVAGVGAVVLTVGLLPVATAPANAVVARPAASAALATPAPVTTQPVPVPSRYSAQRLAWEKCAAGHPDPTVARIECALMRVPRDWNNPNAGIDLKIAVSRLRPAKGITPTRSIVGNPGGPGGSGLAMPLLLNERRALAKSTELVGFDPRGTGSSTSVTCNGAPSLFAIDPRNRAQQVLDLVAKAADLYGDFCHLQSGRLLDFINTEQTVKDIDLLRGLLKRPKIDFVGYSGGSWMGAYYATYFPERTGRFVLDSNTQFTDEWNKTFELQPLGFERRFVKDFSVWAAKYDEQLGLGRTSAEVREFYELLRADLARSPVDVGGFFTVDAVLLDSLVIQGLYSKHSFQFLAMDMAFIRLLVDEASDGRQAVRSTGTLRRPPADLRERLTTAAERSTPPLAFDSFEATFYAITCNDTKWPRGQAYADRVSGEQGRRFPIVGWSLNKNPCFYWDRPALTMPTPDGEGVPPVLMVQSQRDPATPTEGAVIAHRGFKGSRLLTVRNEGDHGVYGGVSHCADRVVDKFLTSGALPVGDTTCFGTGIPAPVEWPEPEPGMPAPPPPPDPGSGTRSGPLERLRSYGAELSAS